MVKELKFRGWDLDNKKMLPVIMINFNDGSVSLDGGVNNCQCILMQYVGVVDKNGKEIYESDILKGHDGFIYRVWAVEGGFAVNVHVDVFKNDIKMGYPFPLQPLADEQTVSYFKSSCEVIGNVYENKNLLL